MKKITLVLAAILAVLTLSGCTSNAEIGSNATNSNSSVESSNSSTDESSDSNNSSVGSIPAIEGALIGGQIANIGDSNSTSSNTEDISSNEETSSTSSSDNDASSTPIEADGYPATRAGNYVRAALGYGEWGFMESIPDEAFEIVIPDFDKSWAEDFCFSNTPVSSNLFKIYVIKPVDGCEETVRNWLNDYRDYCIETAAFYPQQAEQAANSVVGETSDGYLYFICHEEGSNVADYMTASV